MLARNRVPYRQQDILTHITDGGALPTTGQRSLILRLSDALRAFAPVSPVEEKRVIIPTTFPNAPGTAQATLVRTANPQEYTVWLSWNVPTFTRFAGPFAWIGGALLVGAVGWVLSRVPDRDDDAPSGPVTRKKSTRRR